VTRHRSDALAAAGLFVLLAGILCFAGCGSGEDPVEADAEAPTTDEATTEETAAADDGGEVNDEDEEQTADSSLTPLPRRTIEIYFPSLGEEEGLVSEFREIFATATPGDQIKQILADLISGPTNDQATRALPGGTRLRQAYVLDNGVAWLDFSSELTEGMTGGSEAEMMTVYAVVNSVVANVQQVRRVGFLVNGRPVETLNGHLHLLSPLRPNFSLIIGSITVRGPARAPADHVALVDLPTGAVD
jgi:spore germination protein GerM